MSETPSSPEQRLQRQLWNTFNTYRDFMQTQPVLPDDVFRQAPNEPRLYDADMNVVQKREITEQVVTKALNIYQIDAHLVPAHFDLETGENELDQVFVTLSANDGIDWTYMFKHLQGGVLDSAVMVYLHNDRANGKPLIPDRDLLQRMQQDPELLEGLDAGLIRSARNSKQALRYFDGTAFLPLQQSDVGILGAAFKLLRSRR